MQYRDIANSPNNSTLFAERLNGTPEAQPALADRRIAESLRLIALASRAMLGERHIVAITDTRIGRRS